MRLDLLSKARHFLLRVHFIFIKLVHFLLWLLVLRFLLGVLPFRDGLVLGLLLLELGLLLVFLLLLIDFTANQDLKMLLSLPPSTSRARPRQLSRYICQLLLGARNLIFMVATLSSLG